MGNEEARDQETLDIIRRNVESGRIQQLILTPPLEWGELDHALIKGVLCMVAQRMLLGKL
jgi:hypothetical protein